MGLFNFFKKQALAVIQWEDSSTDTIVYRYPLNEREAIMNSSTLVVRPSQIALFVHKGEICDVFTPGTYKLIAENIPLLSKILALPTNFELPATAEVYFINTKQFAGNKWGTPNPIMMRDADFGTVRLRAFGIYSFRVDDAKKFMEELFGTNKIYKVEEVVEKVKPMIIQSFADAVAESGISTLDLAANYREFSSQILEASTAEFSQYGLKLTSIVIENVSLPPEVEATLDERTKLGILSDKMGTYAQKKAADAMEAAAKNPNGNGFAGMGVGLGAGVQMGTLFSSALSNVKDEERPEPSVGKKCHQCGASVSPTSKFCPECGAKMNVKKFCPECGNEINTSSKFCPECGFKL